MARPRSLGQLEIGAVREGLRLIDEYKPDAIWSTYPIATAHLIGAELHRRSGIPWFADFRDPMAQEGYPADPWSGRAKRIEEVLRRATRSLFITPGAARFTANAILTPPSASPSWKTATTRNLRDRRRRPQPFNPGTLTLVLAASSTRKNATRRSSSKPWAA